MIYKFRIILDTEEDVIRDIEIEASATLEDFHYAIAQSFGFEGREMASFYKTNDSWEQGEEIPLIDMDENIDPMGQTKVEDIFNADNHQLIYVYDFLALWTFFVELMEVGEKELSTLYPNLLFAQGETPEEAPEKTFIPEDNNSDSYTQENHDLNDEGSDIDEYNDEDFY